MTDVASPVVLPGWPSAAMAINQYFKVVSYDIPVTNGDKVFFTLLRDDPSPGYGDIGILRMTAQLVQPG
jgi:hypothetical protein